MDTDCEKPAGVESEEQMSRWIRFFAILPSRTL